MHRSHILGRSFGVATGQQPRFAKQNLSWRKAKALKTRASLEEKVRPPAAHFRTVPKNKALRAYSRLHRDPSTGSQAEEAACLSGSGQSSLASKRLRIASFLQAASPVFTGWTQELDVEDKGPAPEEDKKAAAASGSEIYIGFDKSDTEPRLGRKGRIVTDDITRYPEKDTLTGGWAGGEVGLQQFIEEDKKRGKKVEKAKVIEADEKSKGKLKAVTSGGEEIYLGFSKEELEARKSGGRGRSITDDPRKYPNKENFGIFSGVTGGFAGGEKGVQQFVEKGEITLDEQRRREASPILIAALVAGGVTTGAILLNSGVVISEQAITETLQGGGGALPPGEGSSTGLTIDANTKLLLNAAFALIGLGSVGIGARAVIRRLQQSTVQLKEDALNVGKIAGFWILVLVAALYIIDSQ